MSIPASQVVAGVRGGAPGGSSASVSYRLRSRCRCPSALTSWRSTRAGVYLLGSVSVSFRSGSRTCHSACMGCAGPDVNRFQNSEQTAGRGRLRLGTHATHSWGAALGGRGPASRGLLGMGCVARRGLGLAFRGSIWLPQRTEVFQVFPRPALRCPCEPYGHRLAPISRLALKVRSAALVVAGPSLAAELCARSVPLFFICEMWTVPSALTMKIQ